MSTPPPPRSDSLLLAAALAVCAAGLLTIGGVVTVVAKGIARGREHGAATVHFPSLEERVQERGMASRGAAVFEAQLCISCHGKFLEGGVGPCLTDAVWAKGGRPEDLLKSINEGSSEKGMPAFASMLPEDDKIALIAFIRSRAQGLRQVKYQLYEGAWNRLPDFSKLKPVAAGELKDDESIALAKFERSNNYGVVYQGKLLVPAAGTYQFQLGSDDGSAVFIDGAQVVANDGLHNEKAKKTGEAQLKAGAHAFELRFFQEGGGQALNLTWNGPVSSGFLTEPVSTPEVLLVLGQARVLRGNVQGQTGAPMLALGFPGGVNCAVDTERGTIPLAWRGEFLDVGGSRLGRGEHPNLPLGGKVLPLAAQPLVRLAGKPDEAPEFLGYRVSKAQVVLHWRLGGARFDQTLDATATGLRAVVSFADPVPGALLLQEGAKTRTVPAAQAGDQVLLLPF